MLDAGQVAAPGLKVFAQCTKDKPGRVTVLAMNLDRTQPRSMTLAEKGERYTLTAAALQEKTVRMNGAELALDANGDVPKLKGAAVPKGEVTLAPVSISFFVVDAANGACR